MNARASENDPAISRSSSASKSVEIFGPRYIGDDFFLGPNLVSFNRNPNYSAILATLQITSYAIGV
jgi:hypothetical protein